MSYREKKQTPPNRQEKRLERKNCCVSHVCKTANPKFLHVRIRKHFSIDWYLKILKSFFHLHVQYRESQCLYEVNMHIVQPNKFSLLPCSVISERHTGSREGESSSLEYCVR